VDSAAVVIGAGVGGLAAARVLSRRFAHVTVIDRDTAPLGVGPRRGAAQGAHGHILLVSGLRELTTLFPGLDDELIRRGAVRFDVGSDIYNFRFGRSRVAAPAGRDLTSMSRPLLESVLRDRVTATPRVTFRDGVAVTALTGAGGAVTGVVLDTGEVLAADLVVDCSGRGSRSDRWLGELGLPAPRQLEVKIGVGYATRLYRRVPGQLARWQGATVLPDPPASRPAAAGCSKSWTGTRPAISPWVTPCAASTRSTARA
jgi:2-polyprenyl-6-methoxyphenol hydroxylase-like FAD-dependent oxidoreductase